MGKTLEWVQERMGGEKLETLSRFSLKGKREMWWLMEGKIGPNIFLVNGEVITILHVQWKDPGQREQ